MAAGTTTNTILNTVKTDVVVPEIVTANVVVTNIVQNTKVDLNVPLNLPNVAAETTNQVLESNLPTTTAAAYTSSITDITSAVLPINTIVGLAPQFLTAGVIVPDITTQVITNETTTTVFTPSITTLVDTDVTNATTGKFLRGLDVSKLSEYLNNYIGKNLEHIASFLDTFSYLLRYRRVIDTLLSTSEVNYIVFNKTVQIEFINLQFDRAALNFNKNVTTTSNFQDLVATKTSFYRTYLDLTNKSSDLFQPSFYKKSNDVVFSRETINQNLNIFRTFLDTVFTLEQLSNSATINGVTLVGLYKRVLDEANFSLNPIKFEYYNLQKDIVNSNSIVNISVNKRFSNLLNLKNTDIFKFALVKNLGKESSLISDTLSKALTYNRKLFDSIFITDDYYGAATIDDDQYASFNKTVAEQLVFAQNSTKYIRLIKFDLLLNSSVNNLKLYKTLYNLTNYAYDVKTTRYLKNILNTNSLLDTKTFNVLKVASSITNVSSYFNTNSKKLVLNTVDLNTNTYLTSIKGLLELNTISSKTFITANKYLSSLNVSITDSFSKTVYYYTNFADSVDITDDYYGVATLGDDEYVRFNKATLDQIRTTENSYAYFGLNSIPDTATITSVNRILIAKDLYNELNTFRDTNYFTYSIPVIENIFNQEYTFNYINKQLVNTNIFSITTALDLNKYLDQQYFNIVDVKNTSYLKNANNIINISITSPDFIVNVNLLENKTVSSKHYKFTINNVLVEIAAVIQINSIFTIKPFFDSIFVSDSFNKLVNYAREFADSIDITDDYYGVATLGDDEYAVFNKAVLEQAYIKENNYAYFGLNSVVDTATINSVNRILVVKDLYNNLNTFRDINYFTYSIPVFESILNQEKAEKYFDKPVLNIVLNSSSSKFDVYKYFYESISKTDLQNLAYLKYLESIISATKSELNYFTIQTVTASSASLLDANYLNTFKDLLESNKVDLKTFITVNKYPDSLNVFSTDNLTKQLTYNTQFSDSINITDDYYGAATLGDDEYVSFNKTTIEQIYIQENNYKYFSLNSIGDTTISNSTNTKLINNTNILNIGVTETQYLNSSKFFIENIFNQQLFTKYFNKLKLETVQNFSINVFNINQYFNQSIGILELQNLTYLKYLSNSLNNISDSAITETSYRKVLLETNIFDNSYYTFNLQKNVAEPLSLALEFLINFNKPLDNLLFKISDSFVKQINYSRQVLDTVDITDDYYGVATLGDDEYVNFNKTILDLTLSIQILEKYITTKLSTDTIINTDFVGLIPNKYIKELNLIAEIKRIDYFKNNLNVINIANPLYIAAKKSIKDLFSSSDYYYSQITFRLIQQDSVNSIINFKTSIRANKLENIFSNENLAKTPRLNKLETVYNQPDIFRKRITKVRTSILGLNDDSVIKQLSYRFFLNDSISITDDYYGFANIDDDQIVTIRKRFIELIRLTETYFNKNIYTNKFNRFLVSSEFKKLITKPNSELINFTALYKNFQISKVLNPEQISILSNTSLNTSIIIGIDQVLQKDLLYFNNLFIRNFNEQQYLVFERQTITIRKLKLENLNIFSENLINLNKVIELASIVNDTKKITLNKLIDLELFNIFSETTKFNIDKLTDLELFNVSDNLDTITSYNRSIFDTILATDDYYGVATLDDDQYAIFNKTVVNAVNLSEHNSKFFTISTILEYNYIFEESSLYFNQYIDNDIFNLNNSLETTVFGFDKLFNETVNKSEESSILIEYNLDIETVSTSEVILFGTGGTYRIEDIILGSYYEEITLLFDTTVIDSVLKQDLKTIEYLKNLQDIPSITEKAEINTKKSVFNINYIADSSFNTYRKYLLESKTTQDTQKSIVFSSNKQESILKYDFKAIRYSKILQTDYYSIYEYFDYLKFIQDIADSDIPEPGKYFENVKFRDSGVINVQDYLSENYLDPGYIGTNTNIDIPAFLFNHLVRNRLKYTELFITSNAKQFNNLVRFTDSLVSALTYVKLFNDLTSTGDIFTRELNYSKDFNELITTVDAAVINKKTGYNLSDSISTLESGTINNQNYFGENYLDSGYIGRTIYINGNWIEYLLIAQFTYTDIFAVNNTKRFNETIINTDTSTLTYGKRASDLFNRADASILNYNKLLNDLANKTDAIKLNYAARVSDLFNTADANILKYTKQFNDLIITVEDFAVNKNTIYNFSDSISIYDYGTINTQDYFSENYLDPQYIGTVIYFYGKFDPRLKTTIKDTTKLTDSGIINKQNYAISNYAIPGYAGTNTIY
jgi:hypothetical protein